MKKRKRVRRYRQWLSGQNDVNYCFCKRRMNTSLCSCGVFFCVCILRKKLVFYFVFSKVMRMHSVLLEDAVTVYGGKASSILSDIGKGVPDASMRSTSYLFSLHIFTQSVHRYFDIRDSSGWESACIYISAR